MATHRYLSSELYEAYRKALTGGLSEQGVSEDKINEILEYADRLHKNGVPIIFDQPHLAALLGYDLDYLQVLSTCKEDFYKEYKIPKRSGGFRVIDEPLPNLKEIQRWILDNILLSPDIVGTVSSVATAFIPERDIILNARPHVGRRVVICMDIKDFFPSVKWYAVYLVFVGIGYKKDVAGMLAHLCTLRDSLPQGAPTSPMLSNLVLRRIDNKIASFCEKKGVTYTRYADDLTFSMDDKMKYGVLMSYVRDMVRKGGFTINERKTKVYHRNHAQYVTGIVVNERLHVARKYRRDIRQEIYYLQKYGLPDHYSRIETRFSRGAYLNHLLGKINFVVHVNPEDEEMSGYRSYLKKLIAGNESCEVAGVPRP